MDFMRSISNSSPVVSGRAVPGSETRLQIALKTESVAKMAGRKVERRKSGTFFSKVPGGISAVSDSPEALKRLALIPRPHAI